MKVAVGVPYKTMVHGKFAFSLAQVVAYSTVRGIPVMLIDQTTSIIEKGRHEIVEKALELEATHVLFLDSDMVFPMDILERLLASGKEIIGCDYPKTTPPHGRTSRGRQRDGTVEDIGTGCLLVDLRVFRMIGTPYFKVEWDAGRGEFQGEDYNFCLRARLAGFQIYMDKKASKEIVHLGLEGYTLK